MTNEIKKLQSQVKKGHKVASKDNLEMQEEFKRGSTKKPTVYNRCDECGGQFTERPCRINLFIRDPEKKYFNRQTSFIRTINRVYDKKCFTRVMKDLKKVLKEK